MQGKLMFGAGLGLGYVLGTRAGRERFSQISGKARQVWGSKPVQDAAGAVQEQAGRLYEGGKHMVTDQAHKMQKSHPKGQQQQSAQREEAPMGRPLNSPY
jgi:hypothetical protein